MMDTYTSYEKFLLSRGHSVIHSDELWYNVRPYIYQTANYSLTNPPDSSKVYKKNLALACRWFEHCKREDADIVLYISTPPYNLEKLTKKSRNQTKRGLENFSITTIKPENHFFSILQDIYVDNLTRLNLLRNVNHRRKAWQSWWETLKSVDDLTIWAAQQNDSIEAFVVTVKKGNGVEIVLERSSTKSLSQYPNNALIYFLTKEFVANDKEFVSYGLEGFFQKPNSVSLSHFKQGMGYEPVFLRERYSITPLLSWLFSERDIYNLAQRLRKGVISK